MQRNVQKSFSLKREWGAGLDTGWKFLFIFIFSTLMASLSLSPIVEEPTGYSNDIYDYDVNINQPLQGDEAGEFIFQYDLCKENKVCRK